MIEEAFGDSVGVCVVPDVNVVVVGRDVGYEVIQLPKEIEAISATDVRNRLREVGKLIVGRTEMSQVESDLRLAVVGCPYSGTQYTKEVLCKVGLDVGHEEIKENGTVSWRHAYYRAEDFAKEGISQEFIFHQTRHPLLVIAELWMLGKGPWVYITKSCQSRGLDWDPFGQEIYARCMQFWIYWNEFAGEFASFQFRIEQFPTLWPTFLELFGFPVDTPLPGISTHVNRHKAAPISSWDDLYKIDSQLTLKVLEMANEYGYTQIPHHYLKDPYYKFPEEIPLTLDKSPCP